MNAFPGRTQQLPTPSAAAGAASDAASLEGTQAAGPSQRPQSATAKPGTGATHQTQPPSDAVDSRQATTLPQMPAAPQLKPPAQNGNAFRQQVFSHSAGDLITTQPVAKVSGGTGTQAGFQRHSPQVTPLSEAAVLANRQDPAMPMGPQQDYPKSQHSAPSILQDLRDAAAQGCLQQPQHPSAPICVLSSEQALLDPIQPRQQAPLLEEAHSSQETASTQQAHRPSIASSGTDPSSSGGAPPSYPTQRCSEAQPPAAQATPAGLDHGQQLAVASQRLVEEAAAVADHPDSPPPAPEVAAVARALQEKQPVVRSLRLFEKRAAAEQAAVLRNQDVVLKAAVEQTGVDLASRLAAADSAVPLVLAECLASKRSKRVPGGDPLEVPLPLLPCFLPTWLVYDGVVSRCAHAWQQFPSDSC